MTTRLLLLPATLVGLFAVTYSPQADRPQLARFEAKVRPERQPTPKELEDARQAYKVLGGYARSDKRHNGEVIHHFSPPYPSTADTLSRLPDLPFDYTLDLTIGPDTPRGTQKSLAHLQNLRRVSVHFSNPRDRPADLVPIIAELAAVPNLEHLDLFTSSTVPLTDELAGVLATFPSLKSLTGGGPITDVGLEALARLPKLERLVCQSCPAITDAGLAHLARIPSLRILILQDCPQPTSAGLRHFTRSPRLIGLAVGGNEMKGDALAEIGLIYTLEWLNLTTFQPVEVTAGGLRSIARLPVLRRLELPGRALLTDAGFRALATAPVLEQVNLSLCAQVTDTGLGHLTRMASLKTLNLYGLDQITDSGLKELGRMPNLERVLGHFQFHCFAYPECWK